MKILVCGGRNYGHVIRTTGDIKDEPPEVQDRIKEYQYIQRVLSELTIKYSLFYSEEDNWLPTDIVIIHGGATGADSAASSFATTNFCVEEEYPAEWDKYGVSAGFIRNKKMLDEGKPHLVVAFPGGKGTAMMVKLAKNAGVPVLKA